MKLYKFSCLPKSCSLKVRQSRKVIRLQISPIFERQSRGGITLVGSSILHIHVSTINIKKAVTGHPSRAIANLATVAEGRQTVRGIEVPQLLSPSLEVLPLDTTNPEVLMRNRHLDMLLHPQMAEPLVVRHRVLKTLRNFFDKQGFVEVSTPLIVTGAGGAAARPFETYATELSDTKLNLRVAPELWLKRLIIGGMERIFEIGPAFRNEGMLQMVIRSIHEAHHVPGVDNTHNPEFTICEFYRVMISLEELIATTESLFHELALQTQSYKAELAVQNKSYRTESKPSIPHVDPSAYAGPYARLEFIPTLEREIQTHIPSWTCPDLTNSTTALPALLAVFAPLNIPVPAAHTLPTLLDVLAAHLIEPLCRNPTFITHHPDCMSPLAKSLTQPAHPTSGVRHAVSARAELFVNAREYVNCYEEENSPVAQRRKFERQLAFREQAGRAGDDALGTDREVDEGYLAALEWGMPPTGGWGCGVDRIVMLFSGRGRIADVLPFGTLRNVVGLGGAGARKQVEEEKGESGKSLEEAWKSGFEA